jgi:serine/threonine-protein kinase
MEFVDGADLKAVIEYLKRTGKSFPVEAAVYIAIKMCEGLAYAHESTTTDGQPLKIVHRDVSPPNVLITKHGEVKIVDFGLAKASSQLEKSEAGIIKGKFSYLAPEAALGKEVDHRADIFAVGIILWEMLAGRRLFTGDTDFATVKLVQQASIPSLAGGQNGVPPDLERIMARALARDPDQRYSSARDLGRDLSQFLYRYGRPVSSFDIAELVRGAMGLRKKVQPERASLIDKLIEEALFEFTSLQDNAAASAGPGSAARTDEPIKLGVYEDIGRWADELTSQGEAIARKVVPDVAAGNLAALEEDEPSDGPTLLMAPGADPLSFVRREPAQAAVETPPPPTSQVPRSERRSAPGAAPPPGPIAPSPLSSHAAAPTGGGGAMKAVVVVAVAAILAAGAYFGGLIPH